MLIYRMINHKILVDEVSWCYFSQGTSSVESLLESGATTAIHFCKMLDIQYAKAEGK